MKVLVTGANGFAGSHLVRDIVSRGWSVISLERLSSKTFDVDREGVGIAAISSNRLSNLPIRRVYHDFRAPLSDELLSEIGGIDYIVHNGAEVHAIRSLTDPLSFVQSNAVGVFNMLEAARKLKVRKFIYTSSAEVFGSAPNSLSHNEDDALNPSNPYSAAKAGGEMLCRAYAKSFGLDINIVRTMNMFGESQDLTKFVPMVINKAKTGEVLKVHVRGQEVGSRQWIYIANYVDALLFLLEKGEFGEAYNIAGLEKNNLEIVRLVNTHLNPRLNVQTELIEAPATHDMRYNMRDSKLRSLGWTPLVPFDEGFRKTVFSCL